MSGHFTSVPGKWSSAKTLPAMLYPLFSAQHGPYKRGKWKHAEQLAEKQRMEMNRARTLAGTCSKSRKDTLRNIDPHKLGLHQYWQVRIKNQNVKKNNLSALKVIFNYFICKKKKSHWHCACWYTDCSIIYLSWSNVAGIQLWKWPHSAVVCTTVIAPEKMCCPTRQREKWYPILKMRRKGTERQWHAFQISTDPPFSWVPYQCFNPKTTILLVPPRKHPAVPKTFGKRQWAHICLKLHFRRVKCWRREVGYHHTAPQTLQHFCTMYLISGLVELQARV